MPIETFRASSMREALALVRERLGADAIVLGSREIVRRRFPWLSHTLETELTAAVGIEGRTGPDAEQARVLTQRLHPADPQGSPALTAPLAGPSFEPWMGEDPGFVSASSESTESDEDGDSPAPTSLSNSLFRMFTSLIDAEVDEQHARQLVFEAQSATHIEQQASDAALQEALRPIVESQLRCSGGVAVEPDRCRVAAVVGPAGVGKTTTIAKLAANFHLAEQRRIGLITIDTFRVGAVDQLRTYAEVIGLPMRSASNSSELVSALHDFKDCELVLIDTAGRSPRDEPRILELRDLLSDAAIDEVHLVLSLSSSLRSLASLADRFRVLRPTHLLLTKLDEAAGLGAIYSAARAIDLPLSYFTAGQDVPDDIEPAAANRAARLVLGLDDLVSGRQRGWKPAGDAQCSDAG